MRKNVAEQFPPPAGRRMNDSDLIQDLRHVFEIENLISFQQQQTASRDQGRQEFKQTDAKREASDCRHDVLSIEPIPFLGRKEVLNKVAMTRHDSLWLAGCTGGIDEIGCLLQFDFNAGI